MKRKDGIRAGVLGAGETARAHLRALAQVEDARCEAICDIVPQRAWALAREFGISRVFSRAEELAASRLDVIHVALPPALHAAGVVLGLEAGSHVFVEAPLGVSAAECRAVDASAHHLGKVVGVNHASTSHPAFGKLLEAIAAGRLGGLRHVIACARIPVAPLAAGQHGCWMFRAPGNAVLALGSDLAAQIEVLLGPARRICAMAAGQSELSTGAPFFDSWQAAIECERGTAQLFLSFARSRGEYRLWAVGGKGTGLVDLRRNSALIEKRVARTDTLESLVHSWRHAAAMAAQAAGHFCCRCLDGIGRGAPAGADERGSLHSVRAFYRALAGGAPLPRGLACGSAVVGTCERIVAAALEERERSSEETLIHA